MNRKEEALLFHAEKQGKIAIQSKVSVTNDQELALAYTPGVAEPCKIIANQPDEVYRYTGKGNTIAVISDGSAVLGLGNIGPEAAIPVMEGKAVLFKQFANIDAIPLCLATQSMTEIIQTVQNLAPSFGGINLEDISSPRCFEIERTLDSLLPIPVFHDDQHGTAVVVLAAVMNALRVVNKELSTSKVVVNGPGAAGTAIVAILLDSGVADIIVCDEHGILKEDNISADEPHKKELVKRTNSNNIQGDLQTGLKGADIFIGVSVGQVLTPAMIATMQTDAIVFALANPEPEIDYPLAKQAGVRVMGTGRSDFPNQINNVLAFPGIFKGALAAKAPSITKQMKLAAAKAIAKIVSDEELNEEYVIPNPFNPTVVEEVSQAVYETALKE